MRSLVALVLPAVTRAAWSDGHAGIDRPGATFATLEGVSVDACFEKCLAHDDCESWVHSSCTGCELKNEVPEQALVDSDSECTVHSGVRFAADKGLMPLKYKPLRLGQVAPTGWLRNQLKIQANSLSGHLDHFWLDVNESVWIGGKFDHAGAGHERGPYWLNGVVPLTAQLNASGDTSALDTDLNEQVNSWIYYILDHQTAEGWLGPDDGFGGKGNDYCECTNAAPAPAPAVLSRSLCI